MSDRTLTELRAHWDAFAELFEARFERATLQLAHSLLAQLDLDEAPDLLEVGAGAGGAAVFARRFLPQGARHVATDLSPAMVRRIQARAPGIEALEANAEDLPFADASFSRLIANLCYMLVPDPERALREAARVLAPGGRCAFSVWGRPEHSPLFTLPPRAAEAAGVELPPVKRSNFHLGEREALLARVRAAGLTPLRAWYQPASLPVKDGADFAQAVFSNPTWRGMAARLEPEVLRRAQAELARLADEHLATCAPIALEGLLVVAEREG
ncbi:MAG: class I SAM-dependent methyltransferase [Planctomycetes bacterium]|nr:class I SAM-dependent methyltransferase [Planctomycetota bacterium]